MTDVMVVLYPVSFVLEAGRPCLVSLGHPDGSALSRAVRGGVDDTARTLLRDTLNELGATGLSDAPASARDELQSLGLRFLDLAGTQRQHGTVELIYTATIPTPLAEDQHDISAGSAYAWRPINTSHGKVKKRVAPEERSGPDAMVLDYWRQAFEETDMALDFLPEYLSLLQLRSLYDAVWGFEQDPSGFKRWAVDRAGAFGDLLNEVTNPLTMDESFYSSLGSRLPPDLAAQAGAMTAGAPTATPPSVLGLPVGIAAAVTVNKLHKRRGPEPKWFQKSGDWKPGPTRIENLYPPRPNWTRWETHQGGEAHAG